MAHMVCPTCGVKFDSEQVDTKSLPFCSNRCRQIDLGRWLGEAYGIPGRPWDAEDEPDEAADEVERH